MSVGNSKTDKPERPAGSRLFWHVGCVPQSDGEDGGLAIYQL